MTPEERLAELGHELPAPNPAVANYVGAVTVGNIVFVSGHGPYKDGEFIYKGKLGREVDVATGQAAAALTIVNLLASLKAQIGELERVKRVVKLLVMVNSDPEFGEQPAVAERRLGPARRGVRAGARLARPVGGRDGRAADGHLGRDRGDLRGRVGRRRLPATEGVAGRPRRRSRRGRGRRRCRLSRGSSVRGRTPSVPAPPA